NNVKHLSFFSEIRLSERCKLLSQRCKIEVISCGVHSKDEESRNQRLIRIGLFQQKVPLALTNPCHKVKLAMYSLATDGVKVAARGGVKIFCLQQAWNMPYAFCSGERTPWYEYAEDAEKGPTTKIIKVLAAQYNMVIISPILERDEICKETIWNTAVVIDNHGNYLGKYRRNHIPKVENINEPTYYCEGNTGHPVFEGLSRTKDGLLIAEVDLNLCRQIRDQYGLQMSERLDMYSDLIPTHFQNENFTSKPEMKNIFL
ncbi:hypothetical protein NQ317_005831, partial [Molorchus minor]